MNQLDEMLKDEDRVTESLKRERDLANRIKEDVRSGRKTKEEGAKEAAGALKRGIQVMFEEDPLKAAQIVTETIKGYFVKGFTVGFIVGAILAFGIALLLN